MRAVAAIDSINVKLPVAAGTGDRRTAATATPAGSSISVAPDIACAAKRAVEEATIISEVLNERLSFSLDDASGRMYVQVIDTSTGEVLKQLPPEQLLQMLAQIREMIGLILDEKV